MAKNIFMELQELANLHFIRIFLSLSQNSPVMKSFQLSHTGPFLPFFWSQNNSFPEGPNQPRKQDCILLTEKALFWGLKQILSIYNVIERELSLKFHFKSLHQLHNKVLCSRKGITLPQQRKQPVTFKISFGITKAHLRLQVCLCNHNTSFSVCYHAAKHLLLCKKLQDKHDVLLI